MFKVFITIVVCSFTCSIAVHAQSRTKEDIENNIAYFESKILEKERAIARNHANANSMGNTSLETEIKLFEQKIHDLLEEMNQVGVNDRSEEAFMALQAELNEMKEKYAELMNIQQQIIVELDQLKRENEQLLEENEELELENELMTDELEELSWKEDVDISAERIESFLDFRDGEEYAIVEVDGQFWMAENMRYNLQGSKMNPLNPSKEYGRLYTYEQAQYVCPNGWRLPTDEDWKELELVLGMDGDEVLEIGWRGSIAAELKSDEGWYDLGNGTNESGLSILPAGYYFQNHFRSLGKTARFWSATTNTGVRSWSRIFKYAENEEIRRYYDDNTNAYSCRCLKE